MKREPRNAFMEPAEEATVPADEVLQAISRALRGDRRGARAQVAKTRNGLESRLQQQFDGWLGSNAQPTGGEPKNRGARLPPPQRLAPAAPVRSVDMMLPNGRRQRVTLAPTMASHKDLAALTRVSEYNTKLAFDAISRNGRAIDQLAASQEELAGRVAKLQANGDVALLRGLVEGLAELDRRVERVKRVEERVLAAQRRSVRRKLEAQKRTQALQTRAVQIQKLHEAVATMQSVALATDGKLLSSDNILLALNQLAWSFAPEILGALGAAAPGATNPLAWLAPLGSLATSSPLIENAIRDRDRGGQFFR